MTSSKISKKTIAIIIPAKNEYLKLLKLLPKINENNFHVIIINDGSKDNTKQLKNNFNNLKIVNLKKSIGYDNALKYGLLKAKKKFKFAITMDSDFEHDPKYFNKFINYFEKDFDLVIGERNRKNRLVEIIFSFYFKKYFYLNDIFCGYRGIRLNKLKTKHLKNKNISLPEIIFFIHKKYRNTKNFNIKCKERIGGSKFGNSFVGNLKLLIQILGVIFKKI